jgi:hypothetical protein
LGQSDFVPTHQVNTTIIKVSSNLVTVKEVTNILGETSKLHEVGEDKGIKWRWARAILCIFSMMKLNYAFVGASFENREVEILI